MHRSKSVIPRLRIAACHSAFARQARSHSRNSSTTMFG